MKKRKRLLIAPFAVYLAATVYLLFMRHAASDMLFSEYVRQNTNFIPFFSFYVLYTTPYISYRVLVPFCVNLFGNLALFFPWGVLLPMLDKRLKNAKSFFLLTACVIIAVELTQLILKVGICDIEDFILNMLGAAAGWLIIRRKTDC